MPPKKKVSSESDIELDLSESELSSEISSDEEPEIPDDIEEPEDDPAEEGDENDEEGEDIEENSVTEDKANTESIPIDCIYDIKNESSEDDNDELDLEEDVKPDVQSEERRSKPFLFNYERVRLLGDRTNQLVLGAKPMLQGVENMQPKRIAELELENNVMPLIVQRQLPNGKKEKWFLHELKH